MTYWWVINIPEPLYLSDVIHMIFMSKWFHEQNMHYECMSAFALVNKYNIRNIQTHIQKHDYYDTLVTECIVCVSRLWPFNFSFLSFSVLTGWEYYSPNYLKC